MPDSAKKKKWIHDNTTFIGLKLNNNTDYDILDYLKDKPKQTEIKRMIRLAIYIEEKEATHVTKIQNNNGNGD